MFNISYSQNLYIKFNLRISESLLKHLEVFTSDEAREDFCKISSLVNVQSYTDSINAANELHECLERPASFIGNETESTITCKKLSLVLKLHEALENLENQTIDDAKFDTTGEQAINKFFSECSILNNELQSLIITSTSVVQEITDEVSNILELSADEQNNSTAQMIEPSLSERGYSKPKDTNVPVEHAKIMEIAHSEKDEVATEIDPNLEKQAIESIESKKNMLVEVLTDVTNSEKFTHEHNLETVSDASCIECYEENAKKVVLPIQGNNEAYRCCTTNK